MRMPRRGTESDQQHYIKCRKEAWKKQEYPTIGWGGGMTSFEKGMARPSVLREMRATSYLLQVGTQSAVTMAGKGRNIKFDITDIPEWGLWLLSVTLGATFPCPHICTCCRLGHPALTMLALLELVMMWMWFVPQQFIG
ncbi:hypothetical protein H1C71_024112 [Ictidomys tridecemlineatus]|nr:hypothetical protein H1C71_024112 [Ictidomys tridecemlineatus]